MNQDLVDLVLIDDRSNLQPPTKHTRSSDIPATQPNHRARQNDHTAAPPPPMAQDTRSGAPAGDAASAPAAVCPVDHKAREAWLQQARNSNGDSSSTSTSSATSTTTTAAALPPSHPRLPGHFEALSESRQISTIPRSLTPGPTSCPSSHSRTETASSQASPSATPTPTPASVPAAPANSEADTGHDAASGNWIYPSERMFFEAMRRKGHDGARTADMATIVPIHNAVNERAWKQIKEWEAPYTGAGPGQCGGPKLHSFMGDSKAMTPRARINTILGYTAPFDRHDWVVDRCGTKVDYVIDFYEGRKGAPNQNVSFYLDVRPKLNSWEGVKMRFLKGFGLV